MTSTCRCSRPLHNQATVCDHCTDTLTRALGHVSWLDAQLQVTITRQHSHPIAGGAGASGSLPWHEQASEARRELHALLVSWVRLCEDDHVPPAEAGPTRDDLPSLARWLGRHIAGLVRHDAGADAVEEITDAVATCLRLIDNRPDREFAGPCPLCHRDLYHAPGQLLVTCHNCGASWDADALRSRLQRQVADRLVTAREGAFLLCLLGHPIRQATIDTWHQRRRLVDRGHVGGDPNAPRLYLFADLLELADARPDPRTGDAAALA